MSEPIVAKDGSPFKNASSAKVAFTKKKLDAKKFVIEECEGGYHIVEAPEKIPEPVVIDRKGKIQMGEYPVIRIAPAGRGEPKKVPIGLRGVTFVVERGKNICLPRAYVGVLDIAVETVWPEVTEGEEAQPVDRPRFPYTFIRNGTKEEFTRMVKEGASID